jgi:hypothetical protein
MQDLRNGATGPIPGALCPVPRGISRSRFVLLNRGNNSDVCRFVDVLRLVEDDTAALRFGFVRR